MRVLLIANYIPDAQQSMQRFASLLDSGLKTAGLEVRVIRPPVLMGKFARGHSAVKLFGYIDKLFLFPHTIKRHLQWAHVVHICDHSNSFYTKYLRQPHVVTCHDTLAIGSALGRIPLHKTRWSGRVLQRLILNGLIRAQYVTCVSEATRKDLQAIARLQSANISVTYNGLNYPFSPMPQHEAAPRLRRLGVSPEHSYLLHVGGNQWYKNRPGVLNIYAECRKLAAMKGVRLVMVGKPWTPDMRRIARSQNLDSEIVALTDTSPEDLRALYSSASLLLFPSLAEGFGWPILEAQACGCRVATSDRAPMTEVGGPSAVYFDPEKSREAAATIAGALQNRAGDRNPPVFDAARFSTAAMIGNYINLYDRVLQSAKSPR